MYLGETLGRYRLTAVLGKGGMGEVYRGRDVSLGRDVAIKILPSALVSNPESLSRLRREARLLATLNHPNVATLYGFEEDGKLPFLVLELVEGETLASKLDRGPLPLSEALRDCRQIAAALSAAHERGIIHRDVKPSNVMVRPDGHLKLLDFGLARSEPVFDSDVDTLTSGIHTSSGRILGTLPYMSPEQARGLPLDQRSDIWAFGCVLYETIAGRRPFAGATPSDLLAAILERDPDWQPLAGCPPKIRDLIRRCLKKDRDDRLHHIADARIEIDEASAETSSELQPMAPSARWGTGVVAGLALALLVLASVALFNGRVGNSTPPEPVRRFAIDLGSDTTLAFGMDYPASVAITPRGDLIAFVADSKGARRIHVRALDDTDSRPLPGTDGAQRPFFSPDGRWLGFFADGKLKKISPRGGAPLVLCAAPRGMGGAWSPEGWIVFSRSYSSLWRVREAGGEPEVFSRVKPEAGEQAHLNPVLLPDGRTVVFTVWTGGRDADSRVALQAPGDERHRILFEGGSHAAFLPPKHLIYGRARELLAVEFDPVNLSVKGTPFRVFDGVLETPGTGSPVFAVAAPGVLLFAPAVDTGYAGRVVWLDRAGKVVQEVERGSRPRLSPDRTRVAFHFADPDYDVWVKDLGRGTRLRLTKNPGWDGFAVWSPDSRSIVFSSFSEVSRTLFLQAADGIGAPERLLAPGNSRWPTSWSPDGKWLAYNEENPETAMDVWLLDMTTRRPAPFARTRFKEAWARFSPDGEWLAYHSDESGEYEIYVKHLADQSLRLQVSTGGGIVPIWSQRGDEIYYHRGSQLLSVRVRLGRPPRADPPEPLFDTGAWDVNDVHPDGHRFLAADSPTSSTVSSLQIVLGWRGVVDRLAEAR